MATQNISDTLKERLSGVRNKFSNFSFGKMMGSQTSDISPEAKKENLGAGEKSNPGAGNMRTRIINTAYYTTVSEGQHRNLKKGDGLADILAKIYNLLKVQNKETKKIKSPPKSSSSSKIYKSEKTNQYEDIIELLMPAFSAMKTAFAGIKGLFASVKGVMGGVVGGVSGIIGTISSLIGGTLGVISNVLADVFSVVKMIGSGIFSLSKGVFGLTGSIVAILSDFIFKDIVKPLTTFLLRKMVAVATSIAGRVARNVFIDILYGLFKTAPGPVKAFAAAALAALGIAAASEVNDMFEEEALDLQIGPEATKMIYGLKILKERAEEEEKQEKEKYQKLIEQRDRATMQGPNSEARRIYDTMVENRKNYKPVTVDRDNLKLSITEYEKRKKEYQEGKLKEIMGEDWELNPNDTMKSLLDARDDKLGLGYEKIYGLKNKKTGETISPLQSVALLKGLKSVSDMSRDFNIEDILPDGAKNLAKRMEDPFNAFADEASNFLVAANTKLNNIENTMGTKLEEISKVLKEAGYKVLTAPPVTNVINNVVNQGAPKGGGAATPVSLRSDEDTFIYINFENSRFV